MILVQVPSSLPVTFQDLTTGPAEGADDNSAYHGGILNDENFINERKFSVKESTSQ